jgi:NNP family nitrate/nitrite transporter-like MFS transporter
MNTKTSPPMASTSPEEIDTKMPGVERVVGGLKVNEGEKATELKLASFQRPYMRAFWASTMSFFIAFLGWFAFAPLITTIRDDLNITKSEVGSANIASVAATIAARFIVGPLCDKFGPRRVMAILLWIGAIAVGASAIVVQDGNTLIIMRLLIGVAGATFVCNQFWTSLNFAPNIVGVANALSAGWGNLGGGATFLCMPLMLKMFKAFGLDEGPAWRASLLVPAVAFVLCGIMNWWFCDDCPQGNYENLKEERAAAKVSADTKMTEAEKAEEAKSTVWLNRNSWILFIQYGCCFGVELCVNNQLSLYLFDWFCVDGSAETDGSSGDMYKHPTWDKDQECSGERALTKDTANIIASLFALSNLFARGLGGGLSDKLFAMIGFRGRLWAQFISLFLEGMMLLVFSQVTNNIPVLIIALIGFSLFVQSSEGTTYGIVPSVNKRKVGAVAGIVGAGGNVGALTFATVFKQSADWPNVFFVMGFIVAGSAFLTFALDVDGARITPGFSRDTKLNTDDIPGSLTQSSGATPTQKRAAGEVESLELGTGIGSPGSGPEVGA